MLEFKPSLSFPGTIHVYKDEKKIGHYEQKGPYWNFYVNSIGVLDVPSFQSNSKEDLLQTIRDKYDK